MTKPIDRKSPEMQAFLDRQALAMFGRTRSEALATQCCVMCGEPATQFRDTCSAREYEISGMCQQCQDDTFGPDPEAA